MYQDCLHHRGAFYLAYIHRAAGAIISRLPRGRRGLHISRFLCHPRLRSSAQPPEGAAGALGVFYVYTSRVSFFHLSI